MRSGILCQFLLASALAAHAGQPPERVPPRPPGLLRVVSYNIEKGSDPAAVAADLRALDPDVALLQEVDQGTRRAKGEDQTARLADAIAMHAFFAPSYDDDGGKTGCAILSRFPLSGTRALEMPHSRNLGAVARIRWQGRDVELFSVHLAATYKVSVAHLVESAELRLKEARHLDGMLDKLPKDRGVVFGGDLNAPPGSDPYRVFASRLANDGGQGFTYPAAAPLLRIDHLFSSKTLRAAGVRTAARGASDHRPLVVDYALAETPGAAPAGPQGLRVLTWNIQYGRNRGADPNGWPKRKAALAELLKETKPQVLCVQEALAEQLDFLKEKLLGYDLFAQGRDDGKSAGEHCAIFYDRERFERTQAETFWLSDTPETPSRTWGDAYNRICTWVELTNRASGRRIRVCNTHFPLEAAHRTKAARLVAQRLEALAPLPTLLMGDFNEPAGPSSWPDLTRAGLFDVFGTAKEKQGVATFRWKGLSIARLDWVLASPEWRAASLRAIDRAVEGVYPSDHYGVLATLDLPEIKAPGAPKKE